MNVPAAAEAAVVGALSSDPCWVCGNSPLVLKRRGRLPPQLSAEHFKITDSAYGCTADIFECSRCGFRQAGSLGEVLQFYEAMSDEAYEHSRDARSVQARMLLRSVGRLRPSGRLLDVGAGSGILVAEALRQGYVPEGIEPSGPLSAQARARDLPVHHGVLPKDDWRGVFDIATVIDVIEHVGDPLGLLRQVHETLRPDGLLVVVTPDVASVMARLLGWRWWHYRIAHIGYFNRATLTRAVVAAGFEPIAVMRPAWYFPMSYLCERALVYAPKFLRFKPPARLDGVTVPLNLFDSLLMVARRR
jgi:SAM-dependent methyltransferase